MLRHIKPGMLVFSVLYILLGLLLLLAPQAVADVFCIALGLLVVLCGLQSLYGYFKKDNGSIRAAVYLLCACLLYVVLVYVSLQLPCLDAVPVSGLSEYVYSGVLFKLL